MEILNTDEFIEELSLAYRNMVNYRKQCINTMDADLDLLRKDTAKAIAEYKLAKTMGVEAEEEILKKYNISQEKIEEYHSSKKTVDIEKDKLHDEIKQIEYFVEIL